MNKKILFLGSTNIIAEMVKMAQKMGLYTIVIDNKPLCNAPAKLIADYYEDIDISHINEVVSLIHNKNINGVITGFSDSYLPFYYEICEKSGLPCYGTKQAILTGIDKQLFKEACCNSNVGIIPGVCAKNYSEVLSFSNKIGFPMILKPVDNSGSRGVIKCESLNQLSDSFDYALSFSKSRIVICEKFMNCEDMGSSYQLVNGKSYLAATWDRYVYKSINGSSITSSLVYPSKYTNSFIEKENENVKNLFKKYGFHDGMASFQTFVDNKGFYMCEMCYRPSGGQHFNVIDDSNGINSLQLLIEYAVNGKIDYKKIDNPFFDKFYGLMEVIGLSNHLINKISGFDILEKDRSIIKIVKALNKNDLIGADGTSAQVIAYIWFKGDTLQDLYNVSEKIYNIIKVYDIDNNNLVIKVPFGKNY